MRESGEQIIDSPLRRAREYAMGLANSPSPVKHMKNKLGLCESFEISPERCSRSRSPTKFSPEKLSPCREIKDELDNSPVLFKVRRTSTLMKRKSI